MYRWVVKVQKIKNRDKQLDDAMKVIDKNIWLTVLILTLGAITAISKVAKAVPVARDKDFFTQLRKIEQILRKWRRKENQLFKKKIITMER